MRVIRTVPELRAAILERRIAGDAVGLVPTMGVLHDGQLSLVRRAREENGCVVVSCLVNPSGFVDLDEADRRPRDEGHDLALLDREATDIVLLTDVATLYPPDERTRVTVRGLTAQLEGASRPGHMDGLATVLLKLVNLVGPARVYIGQRHAQQIVVLRRLLTDLFINAELVACPTVRDADGLALSSANAQLSIEERHAATCLYAAVSAARAAYDGGERSAEVLRARMTEAIEAEEMARLDYVSVADAQTLAELQRVSRPALAMVAAWIGRTRLTDNEPLAWDVASS